MEGKSGASSRGNSSSNNGTFLKFSTLKTLHFVRHVSQIFNFKNVVMSSGTFLKFSTLKTLPCRPACFSNFQTYKFCHVVREYPHFINLSTCSLDFQLLLFLARGRGGGRFKVRVRVCVGA